MKKIIIFIMALVPNFAFGSDYVGVWVEDKIASIEFNTKFSKQTDRVSQLSKCGSVRIEYTEAHVVSQQDSYTCIVDGKKIEMPGYKNEYKYKLIAKNQDTVVIETIVGDGESVYEILHFVDDNFFWVYTGGSEMMSDSHTRVYFKRVQKSN